MEGILERIERITAELEAIQKEIYGQHQGQAGHSFFEDAAGAGIFAHFKTAVDELRRALWFYIEHIAGKPAVDVNQALQTYRLQRATEMLRALAHQSQLPIMADTGPSGSFFERLNSMVENYIAENQPPSPKSGN